MSISLALAMALVTNAPALQRYEAVEAHMGTLVRIELYARDEAQAKAAFHAAFDRIAQIDAALSDYRPDSELNRISREAVGRPIPISEDFLAVAASAQRFARE